MEFAGVVLLCAALSADAFNVSASCGFNGIKMPVSAKIIIILISIIITSSSVFAGGLLRHIISEQGARCIGAALLGFLGVYMCVGALKSRNRTGRDNTKKREKCVLTEPMEVLADPSLCDADCSRTIERREAAVIGFALSADAFAAGLSSGMSDSLAYLMPILCGVFQVLFLYLGEKCAVMLKNNTKISPSSFGICAGIVIVIMAGLRLVI